MLPRMAAGSTTHTFDVELSHVDRGVYETFSVKTGRHPSESAEYLVTRILAYTLEYEEGIAFTQGLAASDEPAVWIRDLTGRLVTWIEVGTPDPARLHRASKAADRVVVYCHKDVEPYLRTLASQAVHAPEKITIIEVARTLVSALATALERRTRLVVSVNDGELYVDIGGDPLTGLLVRHPYR
jgi:uncharacterized protein YaeQ